MTAAFKEWAIVVDALGRGEQIFILRKGGLHEGRSGFTVDYPQFLFFPTLFHQQRESVIPAAQKRYDEIAPSLPSADILRLQYWAELVEWRHLESFDAVTKLAGQHIWKEEILANRFDWGKQQGIFALALRVHRLPVTIELPMLPEYSGCKSWVHVAHPITTNGSTPALADNEFQRKLDSFRLATTS